MFSKAYARTSRGWCGAFFSAALLIFLPLWPLAANDGRLRLPPRPRGRVEDVNRNPTLVPNRRIYLTYGGEIQFRFPNYTVRIGGYRDGSIPNEGYDGLIFRNDAGMAWDGRGLILTPNYSYRLLVENRYLRGVVGDPQMYWPWHEPQPMAVEEAPARVLEFPPMVGYRSLEPGTIEGYFGPRHGPVPRLPLVAESYIKPLQPHPELPKLGADLPIYPLPGGGLIEP